jgi:hypothetical protein
MCIKSHLPTLSPRESVELHSSSLPPQPYPLPTMASLEIISYEYVPERHRRRSDHPRAGAGKPSRTHRNELQIQQGGLPWQVLQPSIPEICSDARRAVEKMNPQGSFNEPTRQGIQDVAHAPNYEASFGGGHVDKAAFGGEFDYHQAEITSMSNPIAGLKLRPETN